ncbi:MAG: hypothetical protein ACOCQR_03800 [bacterium]
MIKKRGQIIKSFIAMLCLVFLLVGCQVKDYSKEGLEIVHNFYESMEAGKFERASSFVAPNLRTSIINVGRTLRSANIKTEYSDVQYRVVENLDNGVVIRATYLLTTKSRTINQQERFVMELTLAPVRNSELSIIAFREININN